MNSTELQDDEEIVLAADQHTRLEAYKNSKHFQLRDYIKRRIEYWQPVLYFKFACVDGTIGNLDFRICAKNASSSIKGYYSWLYDSNWINNYGWNEKQLLHAVQQGRVTEDDMHRGKGNQAFVTHYATRRLGRILAWNNTDNLNGFWRKGSHKVAIKRDPIKRFVSAYLQIWDESAWGLFKMHSYNIDMLLDKLDTGEYWNEHLAPQSFWLGEDKKIYDAIFDVSDTDKCIQYMHNYLNTKRKLGDQKFHLMKSNYPKPDLTREQISKIEKLYIEDYENGWY